MIGVHDDDREKGIAVLMQKATEQANFLRGHIKHLPEHLVDELIQEVHLRLFTTLKNEGLRSIPNWVNQSMVDPKAVNRVLWQWQLKCALNLNRYCIRGLVTRRKHHDRVVHYVSALRRRLDQDGKHEEESTAIYLSRFAIARKIKATLSPTEWLQLKQCLKERKNLEQPVSAIDSQQRYRLTKRILTILKSDE